MTEADVLEQAITDALQERARQVPVEAAGPNLTAWVTPRRRGTRPMVLAVAGIAAAAAAVLLLTTHDPGPRVSTPAQAQAHDTSPTTLPEAVPTVPDNQATVPPELPDPNEAPVSVPTSSAVATKTEPTAPPTEGTVAPEPSTGPTLVTVDPSDYLEGSLMVNTAVQLDPPGAGPFLAVPKEVALHPLDGAGNPLRVDTSNATIKFALYSDLLHPENGAQLVWVLTSNGAGDMPSPPATPDGQPSAGEQAPSSSTAVMIVDSRTGRAIYQWVWVHPE